MDGRRTWTDCDEAGDYVVPNVLSPRDLVFRPDNMEKLYHIHVEAILMSTHNIGFNEDLTKIIFHLPSKIIKYAPYLFF